MHKLLSQKFTILLIIQKLYIILTYILQQNSIPIKYLFINLLAIKHTILQIHKTSHKKIKLGKLHLKSTFLLSKYLFINTLIPPPPNPTPNHYPEVTGSPYLAYSPSAHCLGQVPH